MPNLRYSLFLFWLLLSGCSLGHYGRLKPADVSVEKRAALQPIFKDNFNSILFKTNIKLYTKAFSGLLLTKQVKPEHYRVIFTTEMGLKLFDFEFKDGEAEVHYTIPQFDRPLFLETIQGDIETLLMMNLSQSETTPFLTEEGNQLVDRLAVDKDYYYYFSQKESNDLLRIERSSGKKKKVEYVLTNHENSFPNHISIQHHDIRLRIELQNLKNF